MAKFKKGDKKPSRSGRKKGVPNKATLEKRLIEELIEVLNEKVRVTEKKDGKKRTITSRTGRILVRSMIRDALKGNAHLYQQIWDRVEGKVKEEVDFNVIQGDSLEARTRRLRKERGLPPLDYSKRVTGPSLNIAPKVIQAEKRKERENREAAAAARSKLKKPKKSFLKELKEKKRKKARKARKGARRKVKRRKRNT